MFLYCFSWFNPYPLIFGTVTERCFWKKPKNIFWRHSWKNGIICAERVSVRQLYDAYLKWHMPIWEEICHWEAKRWPIFTQRDFHEKSKAQIRTSYAMLHSGVFGKRGRGRSRVFDFFQDSPMGLKEILIELTDVLLIYVDSIFLLMDPSLHHSNEWLNFWLFLGLKWVVPGPYIAKYYL